MRTRITRLIFGHATTWEPDFSSWSELSKCETKLVYDTEDQYAVTMYANGVRWVFDRALLIGPCMDTDKQHIVFGEGDVRTQRDEETVKISLMAPGGIAVIELSYESVLDFVTKVVTLVPPGTETYDVDAWLKELGGAA